MPGSPAEKAGLAIGDQIDISATNPVYRSWIYAGTLPSTPVPGQKITFGVLRAGQMRNVTLISEPEPLTTTTKALLVARELALLLFVGIGASLVLLRPSIATWAFYLFCLAYNGAPSMVSILWLKLPWNYIQFIAYLLLRSAGLVGLVVFAVLFLHEESTGWRRTAYRLAPFAWCILSGLAVYRALAVGWFGWPPRTPASLSLFWLITAIVAAMCAFVGTYVSAQGTDRQRMRWVVVGFAIALAATMMQAILARYFNPPYWLYATLLFMPVTVPLTVAYAVVRHRVIDVSFVVSRALIYGVLTTVLVGVFSLIDWFFTDYLRLAKLGTFAEVGAVVAFGLWFNGLHRRIDTLIDATFFRQRHKAEVQLARIAAALPQAPTADTVAQFIVNDPVRALSLASAALFRRGTDDVFVRERSEGWATSDLSRLDASDNALLTLAQSERGPLSLFEHPWRSDRVPTGSARPVLALPIMVRRELTAMVFYGSHRYGEALDPDEVKTIAGLATGAAAAYDHLEAEAMRLENESLLRKNEALEAKLAQAQILPVRS